MTAAVSEVALPYVVASAVVPHITVEPVTKFVPATVSVKSAPPAAAVAGVSEAILGAPIEKMDGVDAAPPGLCTVTLRFPALVIDAAGTVAVMLVAVPAVTVNGTVPR